MNNFKKNFQNFGKTLLFPISMLSFMALFLGLGAALQNPNIIKFVPFLENAFFQNVVGLVRKIAGIPFGNLPILFAMAIPLGMVKRDREVAVYTAAISYIALLIGMNYMLELRDLTPATTNVAYLMESLNMNQVDATLYNSQFTTTLGIFGYNMNVIGGILVGTLTVYLHNKFRATELPEAFSFYSGRRFVPIITAILMVFVGLGVTFVWPVINNAIIAVGKVISDAGSFGVFLYGFSEKVINPTGLHHILNQTFRFTALGGMETIDGQTLVGSMPLFLYQLEHGLPFTQSATRFLAQGKILHMVFGMPAAVFAIYKSAKPENRARVLKFFIPGLTAVILTGITEPIEFTYIFISPVLWIMNAVFAGLAFLVPYLLNVTIGNVQGGVIDWFVFGVLQGNATRWYTYIITGPIFFALYFFAYRFVIDKFNVMTLGRGDDDLVELDETSEALQGEDLQIAENIVMGLGGLDNIVDVDNCISRLRVEVKDKSLVNEDLIKLSNPNGIINPDAHTIHVVYGGRITKIRNLVDDYIFSQK